MCLHSMEYLKMRVKNTLVAAAALSLAAVSATAGGYDAEVIEAPVIVAEPVATGSLGSLGGATPLLVALGVLGVAAAISASDDDEGGHQE